MREIATEADLAEGLRALRRLDPRLAAAADQVGPLPLRRRPGGFAALLSLVVQQQLSLASAQAIQARLSAETGDDPARVVALDDDAARRVGLSGPKARYARALGAAVLSGALDLDAVATRGDAEAIAELTAVTGIGRWTAELYLMFCLGRPDLFPSGDLAVRAGVADALGLDAPPAIREADAIAAAWTPWRSVAARLMWALYKRRKGRAAV